MPLSSCSRTRNHIQRMPVDLPSVKITVKKDA